MGRPPRRATRHHRQWRSHRHRCRPQESRPADRSRRRPPPGRSTPTRNAATPAARWPGARLRQDAGVGASARRHAPAPPLSIPQGRLAARHRIALPCIIAARTRFAQETAEVAEIRRRSFRSSPNDVVRHGSCRGRSQRPVAPAVQPKRGRPIRWPQNMRKNRAAHAPGHYAGGRVAGSRMKNCVPFPGALSTRTSPPCACTTFFTIARPSPVPPCSRDRALSTR